MNLGTATIIVKNTDAVKVAACAARISTTEGTALDVFNAVKGLDKDIALINKVLSSGHKTIIEHQTLSIAFDNVSVLVEQYMIEHRLASFTVKSRRYVNYSGAGYIVPDDMSEEAENLYRKRADELFQLYTYLIDKGVPKEDARFVLPYSFRSNFYVTLNARELIAIMSDMTSGRGSEIPEIKRLGDMLMFQFYEMYPGISLGSTNKQCAEKSHNNEFRCGQSVVGTSELIGGTANPEGALESAMRFSGRFDMDMGQYVTEKNIMKLVRDMRPRELEFINVQFVVKNVSLSCLTHFTRHRVLSLMTNDAVEALSRGDYVLPDSIKRDSEVCRVYENAFKHQAEVIKKLIDTEMPECDIAYMALSGHVTDIMLGMNARELLHFMKLRTCNRAQWEIRRVARKMLEELNTYCEDLFWTYGPSCLVDGKCPEGRLSCGRPAAK